MLLFPTDIRFEFDVSLAEALTRTLDVAVKNNKMFHMREKKDIGMVGGMRRALDSAFPNCQSQMAACVRILTSIPKRSSPDMRYVT